MLHHKNLILVVQPFYKGSVIIIKVFFNFWYLKPSNKNEVKKSINQLLLYPNVCEWFYFPLWPSTPEFTDWLVQYLCHWFVVRLQSGQLEKNHGNSTNSWYSFMIWHGYTLNFKCSILVPVFNAMNWTSRSNPKNNKIKKNLCHKFL